MQTLNQDLRFAFRTLRNNKGFAAAAILSLAIGIGANTSIFSVANALLLQPLPYKDADRLAILWNRSPGLNITEDWFSTAQYFDIKTGHSGFEQLALAIGGNNNLTGDGEPERVGTVRMSSNLLPMLGVKADRGRLFVAEEDAPGRAGTALLSYGMWVRRYGADPKMIGKPIFLNQQPYQVVGILPESFSLSREVMPTLGGAEQADIVLPLPLRPNAAVDRDHEDYNIVGKLKRGVSVAQAQAEMDTITARLRRDHPEEYPPNGGLTFSVVPLQEQVVGEVRMAMFVLLASVGFVLLIACANVANLVLSRAVARKKEIAVRAALGASRIRIVQQLLTESALLALCGGILGALMAVLSLRWIHAMGPKSIPRIESIGIDGGVLLFTFALSLLSGILFGLAPALRISRADLHETLKDASRGSGSGSLWGRRGNATRRILVIAELALSVVLLIGAGLLIRSFGRLQEVPPGFNPKNLLTVGITMSGNKYNNPKLVLSTYREMWQRIEALPGVTAAGGVTALPLTQAFAWGPITVEGRVPPAGENFINVDMRTVGGRYFESMEIPLRKGRLFDEHDISGNPRVIVIDEHMAQQLWPGEDAIGKRIHFGGAKATAPWETVVGVVGRVKQYTLDADSRMAFYRPQTQAAVRALSIVIRNNADAGKLTAAVKNEIKAIDPDLPLYYIRTMAERVDESLARRRFSMTLLGIFAGLALALAAVGIYGVMAYLVTQGTREIGIRMALGATQGGILAMILKQGLAIAAVGLSLGLVGAFALTRFLGSLLFGVSPTDGLTFVAIAGILGFVALLASYVPARRAARIDPMVSLRCD
ncbi:MAG: ABC transporter permease [Bryobacteraceae bacterium]